jgi:hypothetical protein
MPYASLSAGSGSVWRWALLRRLVLVPALGLGLASSTSAQEFKIARGPDVKVDHAEDADFKAFKTYAWIETQQPVDNPANHVRITYAVERELAKKGLKKPVGDAAPDLRVRYFGKIEKRVKGSPRQTDAYAPTPDVKTTVDLSRVTEGTIILELMDDKSRLIVWRTVASEPMGPPDEAEAQIYRLVKAMVARYPPKP